MAYTVEFRRDSGHPWQDACPNVPEDDRYLPTVDDALNVVRLMTESDEIDGMAFEYRVRPVDLDTI